MRWGEHPGSPVGIHHPPIGPTKADRNIHLRTDGITPALVLTTFWILYFVVPQVDPYSALVPYFGSTRRALRSEHYAER
jgi:hypothetical protein